MYTHRYQSMIASVVNGGLFGEKSSFEASVSANREYKQSLYPEALCSLHTGMGSQDCHADII